MYFKVLLLSACIAAALSSPVPDLGSTLQSIIKAPLSLVDGGINSVHEFLELVRGASKTLGQVASQGVDNPKAILKNVGAGAFKLLGGIVSGAGKIGNSAISGVKDAAGNVVGGVTKIAAKSEYD